MRSEDVHGGDESEVEDLDVPEEESEDVKGGKATLKDISITHTVDKSSPTLFQDK